MSHTPTRRLGALAFTAALAFAACSGGATTVPGASDSAGASESAGAGASAGAAIPTPPSGDVSLQGAGATFPAPLYGVWIETYTGKYPNVKIDYQANGSGAGIKAITQGTVDFGASDAPMKDAEIAAIPGGKTILHVPTALGAVVAIFNVPGLTSLNLDGPTLSGIFLGAIRTWNDPAIAALNSGAALPNTPIQVVHRSDGSGTTNAFTAYLSAVSPDWQSKVGSGKEVNWPTGIGAKGNDGIAGAVKQNSGTIGYVELTYATQAHLPMASLKNAAGNFVGPSTAGVTAAAQSAVADFPADFRQKPLVNAAGDQAYPLAAYTYLLVYRDQADATKGRALVSFVAWALTDGQSAEEGLGYAPLPAEVQAKAIAELHTITAGGSPIWP